MGALVLRDKEVENSNPKIRIREFHVTHTVSGRNRFPFKKMLVGDFFRVFTFRESVSIRSALQSFYKRHPGRQFTTRQRDDGEWVCRRVM